MDTIRPAGRGAAVLLIVAAVQLVAAPPSLITPALSPSVRQAVHDIPQHADVEAPVPALRLETGRRTDSLRTISPMKEK
jgi:hypothetical protein